MELPVPLQIPKEIRFEHGHILGGTGHGKTQLLQRMIHEDLLAAREDGRSVVVIDSQGDLINKLVRLDLFDPDEPGSLADRLVLIDPSDIEHPAALNLFDPHLERLATYRPVDRERVLNGVVELYEAMFGDMLGAELTQKQGVVFRYLARLMVTIPGATIYTLMQLMEDGRAFKPQMAELEGSARYFFETEFFHPSFAATKKQILRRLWGVLSTPAFERMFAQPTNKLDLFEATREGKIILISTAKDLLKRDGSALLGRFFINMLAQSALERSVLPAHERTPTFVYVDEAQEYFDESVATILQQARKYRIGLVLAHQSLDQAAPGLRSALFSNTSLKCAGGVSAKDARALADELHTTPEFIESMRRRGGRTEFATWIKHWTHGAVRLSVPLGYLERQPTLSEEAYDAHHLARLQGLAQ
jgi:DNA helicase HerA-like ATPase